MSLGMCPSNPSIKDTETQFWKICSFREERGSWLMLKVSISVWGLAPFNNILVSIIFRFLGASPVLYVPHVSLGFWYLQSSLKKSLGLPQWH